ncbi:MAG: hypothetical protein WB992_26410 [Bryobacteraceae bacterium]
MTFKNGDFGYKCGVLALAAIQVFAFVPQPAFAAEAAADKTTTPIKHVIVIIGENRSFDHVYATYQPKAGQTVSNLLSKGIITADGKPGPNYFLSAQYAAIDSTGTYFTSPQEKSIYAVLPPAMTDGAPEFASDSNPAPFATQEVADFAEPDLPPAYQPFLLTGATGLPPHSVDTRLPDATMLREDRLAVDPEHHRLYVSRSSRVVVLDTETGKKIGEIGGARNVHSVCLDQAGARGWITDGAAGIVYAFDRSTLRITATVPLGAHPNAAVFDPASRALFVLTERGNSVIAIDAVSNRISGTVSLAGKPADAAADGKGALFVSLQETNRIVRINTGSRKITANWPAPNCVGPAGVGIDRAQGRVYSVCENRKLIALDTSVGELVASIEVQEGSRDLAVDPQRKLIFVASGSGTLTVVKQLLSGGLSVAQTLNTLPGARTLALDPATGRIYLPTAQFGLRTGETSEELRFRPTPVPGSFVVLIVAD